MDSFTMYAKAARKAMDIRWKQKYWEEAVESLEGNPPEEIASRLYNAVILDRRTAERVRGGKS
jgi:hypothetical protein